MSPATYNIVPIDEATLAELRCADDAGRPPQIRVDREGGSPLRCCLRCSRPGEQVALVAYAPLRRWARRSGVQPGAYDEVGPIFIHPAACSGVQQAGFPDDLRGAPRVFRAYNHDGTIRDGVLVEPDGPFEQVLDQVFLDPEVAFVHARALAFGCFTFAVHRAGQAADDRPR